MTELEDGLSAIYDWCVGRRGKDRERPREWWEKLFGFLWTVAWFSVTNLAAMEGARKVGDKSNDSQNWVPFWERVLGMPIEKA